jgi:hypothetical protein
MLPESKRGGLHLSSLSFGLALVLLVAAERPGVAPDTPWSCPATHPIKGYVSVEPGRRVYFVPGERFYEEASPERCYATEDEAHRDGSRAARYADS